MNQETIKVFLRDFCLSQENGWSKANQERLKHFTADDVRRLRNSLAHFFSVGKGLGISAAHYDEKSRRLEKATNFKAKFLSPEDLFEITRGAVAIMLRKWSDDCKRCIAENSDDFKERILCVVEVVSNYGAVIVKNNEIDI